MRKQIKEQMLKEIFIQTGGREENPKIADVCVDIAMDYIDKKPNIYWQSCPKCNAQGTVSKPPYISGDIFQWNSGESQFECNVCNGKKIINIRTGKAPK